MLIPPKALEILRSTFHRRNICFHRRSDAALQFKDGRAYMVGTREYIELFPCVARIRANREDAWLLISRWLSGKTRKKSENQ